LEYEINLIQDIGFARIAEGHKAVLPSGFLSLPSIAFANEANTFYLPAAKAETVSYAVEDLAAGSSISNRVVRVFEERARVVAVRVVNQSVAAAGIDDGNTCEVTLSTAEGTIATETFDSTTAFPAANTQHDLGSVGNAHVRPGSAALLSVANGPTANPGPFLIEVDYVADEPMMANVAGWNVPVRGTQAEDFQGGTLNNLGNKISLSAAPSTGSRTDLVYLEVWLALVTGNSDSPPIKPPSVSRLDTAGRVFQKSQVWPFGNILYGGTTLDDDIVDPDVSLETTKRVQLQYAIRTFEGVDLDTYPRGLGDPNIAGIGPQEMVTVVYGTPFRNAGEESGDHGLWISETPDLTVDGKVYAIPICAIHRRNSGGFRANDDPSPNPNGSSPSDSEDLGLRPDGFASDRIVPSDIIDLRHKSVLSPATASSAIVRSQRDAFAGTLHTSFGSAGVSPDVSGSTVSTQKEIVSSASLNPAVSEHIGSCDGLRRVFSAAPTAEKNIFMAISQNLDVPPDPEFGFGLPSWLQQQPDPANTIELTLPAESSAKFSARPPRGILSETQEEIVFNAVTLGPNGKSMKLEFGVGSYRTDGNLNGRHYPQDVWLYFDIEVPATIGIRSEPLEMQSPHATAIATNKLNPGTTQRVAATSRESSANGSKMNNTHYGTLYAATLDFRMVETTRRLAAPLRDATEDGFFSGMFDLDSYIGDADPKPVPDERLTVDFLKKRLDGVIDLDDDLLNIDAGWVSGRRAMFVRPLNATTKSGGTGKDIEFAMSSHAFYVLRDASLPASVPLFTLLSPLPIVHLRGAYIREPGTTTPLQLDAADYTEGVSGEVCGRLIPDPDDPGATDEFIIPAGIVERPGTSTYRLTDSSDPLQGTVPLATNVMQVLGIDKWDANGSQWVPKYKAGLLKKAFVNNDATVSLNMIVPVYIREGGITNQIALLKRTERSGASPLYEIFEFSIDPSAEGYVGAGTPADPWRYRIRYRAVPNTGSPWGPLDTDFDIEYSKYISAMRQQDSDPVSPGRNAFVAAGLRNGHEVFFDADIRVSLPIDAEVATPIISVPPSSGGRPAQTAAFDPGARTFKVSSVSAEMVVTSASPARLGDAVLPDSAANATDNVFVQPAQGGTDFQSEALGDSGSAVLRLPVLGSAGRDAVETLSGIEVRLSGSNGVFNAVLDTSGAPIRVAASAGPLTAQGDLAAYLPVTAVADTGEVVLLMLSQRNSADPGSGMFDGTPSVDTGAEGFAATVYRPWGRPLVKGRGIDAHSA